MFRFKLLFGVVVLTSVSTFIVSVMWITTNGLTFEPVVTALSAFSNVVIVVIDCLKKPN